MVGGRGLTVLLVDNVAYLVPPTPVTLLAELFIIITDRLAKVDGAA